jgi:hypothetical protein
MDIAQKCGEGLGIQDRMRRGAYMMVSGPSYESMVECRFLRQIGGDSVGMSTVPEVVAARHCGMLVLSFSFITNKVVTKRVPGQEHANHAEVLAAANAAGPLLVNLVREIVSSSEFKSYLDAQPVFVYKSTKHTAAHGHSSTPKAGGSLLPHNPSRIVEEPSVMSLEILLVAGLFTGALYAYFKGRK